MNKLLKILSYMPDLKSPKLFEEHKKTLSSLTISGVETIVGDFCPAHIYKKLPIEGIHIIYFPTWLDIWEENPVNLQQDFSTLSPYGISGRQGLIDVFIEQFLAALELKPKYMVFHVSHVRPRDIFTMRYEYTDEQILKASSELLNRVFENEKICSTIKKDMDKSSDSLPYLLFENLPWPGLNFKGTEAEKHFLETINYPKKGFMLDLSHFICLNRKLSNFCEAVDYIENSLRKLEGIRENILGIHLNGSLSKEYLSQDFSQLLLEWESSSPLKRYEIEISHIKSIDTHSIFNSAKLKSLINMINPKFLVYELNYKNFEDLLLKVEIQNRFLDNL